MATKRNDLARRLRTFHVPGQPLVLTNVWDGASANLAVAHPGTKALATASFAISAAAGVKDEELSLEDNLTGIRRIAAVATSKNLPLTADAQDGYGDVSSCIAAIINAGAVGCNIEDVDKETGELRTLDDAVVRIKQAVEAARDAGVPDFCINARTDVLGHGGSIEDVVARGQRYQAAGALTVYVWGAKKFELSRAQVKQLVEKLNGMVNVKMNLQPGYLNTAELADLGVARISVGPEMFNKAMDGFSGALGTVMRKENFK